ncbi:MAG: hypothetical protein RBS08_04465 [Bdellovibrionales bacterium]|jgi:hypothetical protein|nr:hypothetical protein [Bdellovibrionales bacterium]
MPRGSIDRKNLLLPGLSLLTSLGTLVCCALPALLVTIGAGAALAGLVSTMPQLVWLSAHKPVVFGVAGILLAIAGFIQWRNRHAPCPIDPAQARACRFLRRAGWWIWGFALAVYLTGFFFAFIAVHIFYG